MQRERKRGHAPRAAVALALVAFAVAPSAGADESGDVRASARGAVSAMSGNSTRVHDMLRRARAEQRTAAVSCLDARLSRVDAALRSGREEARFVDVALAKNDVPSARRSLATLLGYREATRVAAVEADACIVTVDVAPSDGTVVRIVVDPGLPSDRAVFGR